MTLTKRGILNDDVIREFIESNNLVDSMVPDGCSLKDVVFNQPNFAYIGYYDDSELVAIVGYNLFRDGVKVHFATNGNARHALEVFKDGIDQPKGVRYVETTDQLSALRRRLAKMGFQEVEGGKDFVKNGVKTQNVLMRL